MPIGNVQLAIVHLSRYWRLRPSFVSRRKERVMPIWFVGKCNRPTAACISRWLALYI